MITLDKKANHLDPKHDKNKNEHNSNRFIDMSNITCVQKKCTQTCDSVWENNYKERWHMVIIGLLDLILSCTLLIMHRV